MDTRIDYRPGDSDERPWGRWTVLATGDGYAIKEIEVDPGEILSLQSHDHRAEHWVVLAGTACVTVGNDETVCTAGETSYIPVGAKHRIANTGDIPMRFIELQTGAVLSEDDQHRYDDRYGRNGE